jgi:hypothetical protein
VTFLAPSSDRLVHGVTLTGFRQLGGVEGWNRELTWLPDTSTARSLPPPSPDAMSSPGPATWAAPLAPPTVVAAIEHSPQVVDVVEGREVGDAFELIWPSGEVDGQVLDESFPEPALLAPHSEVRPPSDASPASQAILVLLKPMTAPLDVTNSSTTGAVSDDVVLAVRHAIAAIGSEVAVDEPAWASRLREPSSAYVMTSASNPGLAAIGVDPATTGSPPALPTLPPVPAPPAPSAPTDERRSALKRLISGLRRH